MNETRKYGIFELTSSKIRLLVGFVLDNKVNILYLKEKTKSFVSNGVVIDEDGAYKEINEMKKECEKALGNKIDIYYSLLILPLGLKPISNTGSTVTISGRIVEQIDIDNVKSLASKVSLSDEVQIVDVVPISYQIDGNNKYSFAPINMNCLEKLSCTVKIYSLPKVISSSYNKVKEKAKLDKTLILENLAVTNYLNLDPIIPSDYILLNFGEKITTLSYISNKTNIEYVMPFRTGSSYINSAIKTKFPFLSDEKIEEYKKIYGLDKSPDFDFKLKEGISLDQLSSVIKESLDTNIKNFQVEFEKCYAKAQRTLSIVLIGGGSKLKGLKEYFQSLGIEVIIPYVNVIGARDITYLPLVSSIYLKAMKDTSKNNKDEDGNTIEFLSRS